MFQHPIRHISIQIENVLLPLAPMHSGSLLVAKELATNSGTKGKSFLTTGF